MTFDELAAAYGTTKQNVHRIVNHYGMRKELFSEPDAVLRFLLKHSRRSPLRTFLIDPENRKSIRKKLTLNTTPL
jgi:hypothetical protein